MNEQISWDSSLVKKFSSSNHFKLLNQLKSEVIKYPLSKKKNLSSKISTDNKVDAKTNPIAVNNQNLSISSNSKNNNDIITSQSTISFNNSKNFSIYNKNDKDVKKDNKESFIEAEKSLKDNSNLTFKERLKDIDLK